MTVGAAVEVDRDHRLGRCARRRRPARAAHDPGGLLARRRGRSRGGRGAGRRRARPAPRGRLRPCRTARRGTTRRRCRPAPGRRGCARSRSGSSRPLNSSTSCASRDSTLTSWNRSGIAVLQVLAAPRGTSPSWCAGCRRAAWRATPAPPPGAVASSDSTGVIPEPAAIATWCRAAVGSRRADERPHRGHHLDRRRRRATDVVEPVSTSGRPRPRAAATRSSPSRLGAARGDWQIEYDCRTSSPSIVARSVRCWPGSNANSSRSSSRHGERHRDGVVGEPLDRRDGQRVEPGPVARRAAVGSEQGRHQIALNSSKGSRHVVAAAQGLARGRAEPRDLLGVGGAALRAGDAAARSGRRATGPGPPPRRHGRRAARSRTRAACSLPVVRHPVGGPGRASAACCTSAAQPPRRATCSTRARRSPPWPGSRCRSGVITTRRCAVASSAVDDAQDAEVVDGDDRHLGVGHRGDRCAQGGRRRARWRQPGAVAPARRGHHVAPGWERAMCCISASR